MKRETIGLLRQLIAESLLQEVAPGDFRAEKRAVIVAGPMGAGKTTISKLILGGLGFINRDVDDMLVRLLRQEKMSLDMKNFTPEELSVVDNLRAKTFDWIEKVQRKDREVGRGIIVNMTGANFPFAMQLTQEFKDAGYEVKMLFVDVSLETSLARNSSRERSVNEKVVEEKYHRTKENIPKFREAFGGDFHYFDSEVGKASPVDPQVIKISKDITNWRPAR